MNISVPRDKQYYSASYARRNKYDLNEEQYRELVEHQNNHCAICNLPATEGKRGLSVDHDHETGEIRGLLCTRCNTGLGQLRDDPKLLDKAISYLRGER